ncbi:hypothetical protein RRG08_002788 [Elysia crispata]|uniref:Uncharacterized protein n=1 Tax=Elysia crispata TaxID=231223 RepID=A0AAE0XU26_9GAST|nr:hypothetical protein RRG08_002788 [Elysia crispata]
MQTCIYNPSLQNHKTEIIHGISRSRARRSMKVASPSPPGGYSSELRPLEADTCGMSGAGGCERIRPFTQLALLNTRVGKTGERSLPEGQIEPVPVAKLSLMLDLCQYVSKRRWSRDRNESENATSPTTD